MTTSAELPDEIWASTLGGWWSHVTNAATTRYIRAELYAAQAAEIERITDVWHALHKENIRLAGINAALEDALKRLDGAPMRLNAETHHE